MAKLKKLPFLLTNKGCMSLRWKFGFGNLEPLQFLWTRCSCTGNGLRRVKTKPALSDKESCSVVKNVNRATLGALCIEIWTFSVCQKLKLCPSFLLVLLRGYTCLKSWVERFGPQWAPRLRFLDALFLVWRETLGPQLVPYLRHIVPCLEGDFGTSVGSLSEAPGRIVPGLEGDLS